MQHDDFEIKVNLNQIRESDDEEEPNGHTVGEPTQYTEKKSLESGGLLRIEQLHKNVREIMQSKHFFRRERALAMD